MFRPPLSILACLLFVFCSNVAADIVLDPFGSNGEGGTNNGQAFSFGSGGSIYEFDSFLRISGQDLNGSQIGTSAQLSIDGLPAGLGLDQSHQVSSDLSDVTIEYSFVNSTGLVLQDTRFFVFVDAEIDVPTNDYFNEYASVAGALGGGEGDSEIDYFEVDEPGYVFGDIFDNLRLGELDNSNSITDTFPDDVGMAIGLSLGDIGIGSEVLVSIMLSEDQDRLGNFSIEHSDSDPNSMDTLTFSGSASVTSVPESSSLFLVGFACISSLVSRRRPH